MDIDEWEFLPDHGYLDFNEVGENQIFFGKRNYPVVSDESSKSTSAVLDMNYFCKSPKSKRATTEEEAAGSWNDLHHQRVPGKQQLVHVPIIQLEPRIGSITPDEVSVEEKDNTSKGHHVDEKIITKELCKVGDDFVEPVFDHDTVSQHVFFKIKENEFADMKMDSPRSGSRGCCFPPVLDAGAMRFEDKGDAREMITSPRLKIVEKEMIAMDCDDDDEKEEGYNNNNNEEFDDEDSRVDDGFNLWKWGLTGVGAIFSFGVAAATICVLFFGSQQRNKLQQEHKIRFQIYTDDKRLKQVVQHATKLNEAISAARGVPLSRAHITYGGYYDGL